MESWSAPDVPSIPGLPVPLKLHDSATGSVRPTELESADDEATMYVCGITPYDATHLGHAATYLTFDLVTACWRDAGHDVHYVQNVTDVDDPLFERANRDGDGLERSAAARDPSCSARTWRRCGCFRRRTTSAPSNRWTRSSSWSEKLLATGAAYSVDDRVPRRLLPRRRDRAVRLRVRATTGDDGEVLRRTRRRPGPRRQARPARSTALAGGAAGRAVVAVTVRAGAAGLAHRVRGDRGQPAVDSDSTSRAVAAT